MKSTYYWRLLCLKGFNKSAPGNALGIEAEYSLRALKGRNNLRRNNKLYRPFRACGHVRFSVPRALPWADLCEPFKLQTPAFRRRRRKLVQYRVERNLAPAL